MGSAWCPNCNTTNEAEEADHVKFCSVCGYMLEDMQLVGNIPFQTAMPSQNWVHADEDGRQLGHERHGRAMGVGNGDSLARKLVTLRKNVQRLANLLEVGGSVEARANALVEQVVVGWNSTERVPKSELLTAGCLFIASRESEVPLTIINVALAAGVPAYTLGCAVSVIARSCELSVPQPQVPKFIHRTICALQQLKPVQAAVLSDALQLHDWMEEREIEGSTIPKASAAIMVAAEASQVQLDLAKVAREVHFSQQTLRRVVGKLRQALIDAAAPLPWSASITAANVAQHVRLILKLQQALQRTTTGRQNTPA